MTCSATLTTLLPVISATVMFRSAAAARIEMVGANAGGKEEAKLRRFLDPLSGDVGWPKRRCDQDVRSGNMLIKLCLGVGQRDQFVAPCFQHFTQPKSVFRTSQELRRRFRSRTTRVENGDYFHGSLLPVEIWLSEGKHRIQMRPVVYA